MLKRIISLASVIGLLSASAFAQAPTPAVEQAKQAMMRDYTLENQDIARIAADHTALGSDVMAMMNAMAAAAAPKPVLPRPNVAPPHPVVQSRPPTPVPHPMTVVSPHGGPMTIVPAPLPVGPQPHTEVPYKMQPPAGQSR